MNYFIDKKVLYKNGLALLFLYYLIEISITDIYYVLLSILL